MASAAKMYPDQCGNHPPFDLNAGDRACRTHAEAVALAERRAMKRGRQTVRRHSGWLVRSAWFVQDVCTPAGRNADPELRLPR